MGSETAEEEEASRNPWMMGTEVAMDWTDNSPAVR